MENNVSNKKPLIIGGVIILAVIALVVAVVMFWDREEELVINEDAIEHVVATINNISEVRIATEMVDGELVEPMIIEDDEEADFTYTEDMLATRVLYENEYDEEEVIFVEFVYGNGQTARMVVTPYNIIELTYNIEGTKTEVYEIELDDLVYHNYLIRYQEGE